MTLNEWRKEVGVEPTRERLTPPTGFEARPPHQERFPSRFGTHLGNSVSDKHVRIAQVMGIARAPCVTHAVEEFQ